MVVPRPAWATWWQVVLFTLVTTHITIAAVTIFLHRAQAHRALELHPWSRTSSASGSG
jgi:fatty-acid desaturase